LDEQVRDLATKDIEYELLGPTAGVGDTMIGTTSGPAADFIVGFEMVSLNEKFKTLLGGRVIWGPVAAGDTCLLRTDDSILRAFDANGSQQFEVKLPPGTPVGDPIRVNEQIVMAGKEGWLVAIDAGSGTISGQIDIGQPVSATPLPVGKSLLVPGAEGVVYITGVPGQ
jgi:outer membrane protein assembly factor BamB